MFRFYLVICLGSAALFTLIGCDRNNTKLAQTQTPVPVAYPIQREVTDFVDYTGRTNAQSSVTIVPRVTGYLVRTPFQEGANVKKNDLLFEVDSRPYQAQFDAAEAQVATNEANLRYQKATNKRFKELWEKDKGAVTPRELDQYQALEDQAVASLNLAKSNLISAKLNLEWTKVLSPIDGHISRYFLTPGNLVNQDTTQLTTVVSMDPMYVYFDMDEPTLLRIKKAINEGIIKPRVKAEETVPIVGASTIGLLGTPLPGGPMSASSLLYPGRTGPDAPVMIALAGEDFDEKNENRRGTINFMDNQVNSGTGSISVRGVFANPRPEGGTYLLVPGMFVRVRLPIGQPQQELLVKDSVVTSDQGLKYVYVVGADKRVEARRVTVGSLQEDGMRVITQGLKKDDLVLVGGLQQVRPKMTIPTELVSMPTLGVPSTILGEKTKDPAKGKGKKKT